MFLINDKHNLMIVFGDCVIILQGELKPLWGASNGGRLDTVEALLDRGAEVNQRSDVRT